MKDTNFELVVNMDGRHLIAVDVPTVRHWQIEAAQKITAWPWLLPDYSPVTLIFNDFKFDFRTDLRLDNFGYLDPVVYSCEIDFGKSYLYHDNPVLAVVMH